MSCHRVLKPTNRPQSCSAMAKWTLLSTMVLGNKPVNSFSLSTARQSSSHMPLWDTAHVMKWVIPVCSVHILLIYILLPECIHRIDAWCVFFFISGNKGCWSIYRPSVASVVGTVGSCSNWWYAPSWKVTIYRPLCWFLTRCKYSSVSVCFSAW